MIKIRTETPSDYQAVHRLTVAAFANSELGHHGEADLVDQLREEGEACLSLVAVADDRVRAHILFTSAWIKNEQGELRGMALGPMAVDAEVQNRGIGSSLVRAGLENLAGQGWPFVIVLGHSEYYPRFGFEPASKFEVVHGFDGIPQEVFFVKVLDQEATGQVHGRAFYREEFGPQHGIKGHE